jgi:hypothetical protein
MTKMILATKELTVTINGMTYDCLLIPRERFVNVDYRDCPEDHPRVRRLIEKIRNGTIS